MDYIRPLSQEYRPKEFEPKVLEFWRRERIYEKIREKLKDKPVFYFLDGPPYPSSDTPHVGTLWNKVLKDAIIRFKRARGYNVVDRPGYDCHGLPIEVKVEQELGFTSKKGIESFGVDRFVQKCKDFALRNAFSMTRHFEEFGVSMAWDEPYLTLDSSYVQSAWWLVKRAEEKGLLERGVKVVHWCPRCETTLADYEVTEYRDLVDPSIYVKFPVKGSPGRYLLVWTTTPWTLPANVAIMVNPNLKYVWVEVNGELLLLSSSRLKEVMDEAGVSCYRVVGEVEGRDLKGLEYLHPLADEVKVQGELDPYHKVVLSEVYVSGEEGTGLVHCAPGHGEEDFQVGLEYGLPVVVPVDERGVFTEEAGKYAGKTVREANDLIVSDLRSKGLLFHEGKVTHRYPVCWRCKTPLVLRAVPQWYIRISHMKEKFLQEAAKVKWVPEWAGYARFKNWLEGLRDWVISRQRYWGTPAPIWVCGSCGHRIVVGSLAELELLTKRKLDLEDLHRPWIDSVEFNCPRCGGIARRVEDVLDVWLDSGVSFYASLGYPLKETEVKPVDIIVEGHDQIAGWFFSLLRCGVIAFGCTPYKAVLMHGFALDEKGREMHKSLGNYVSPQQVLEYEKGCRDAFRWYVLRNMVWEDLKFSWRSLAEVYDDLNIAWNTFVFATTYMGLDRYDPAEHQLEKYVEMLRVEDKWILSRIERLTRDVTEWMENYELHKAARALREFIVEDVSRWYVRLTRPRVWVEEDSIDKLTAYAVLHYTLKRFLVLLAPFAPFFAEEVYRQSFMQSKDPESVHMLPWPESKLELINDELERRMDLARKVVERAVAARMKAGVKLRIPLPALYVLTEDPLLIAALKEMEAVISSQANVKKVEVLPPSQRQRFFAVKAIPVYRVLGPVFKAEAPNVVELIGKLDPYRLKQQLESEGKVVLYSEDGATYELTKEMVNFEEVLLEGFAVEDMDGNLVILDTRIGAEERAEGFARDILRRIQFMRKLMKLPIDEYIDVKIYAPPEALEMLESWKDFIAGEARIRQLMLVEHEHFVQGELVQDWEVEEFTVRIGVRRAA